jgi:hypothetical protein
MKIKKSSIMKIIDKQSPEYKEAKEKVEEEKGFYMHLGTYVIVNLFFVALNMLTSPNHLWFFWPMLGWGIGLAFHAFNTFGSMNLFSKRWEEKRIQRHLDESRRK